MTNHPKYKRKMQPEKQSKLPKTERPKTDPRKTKPNHETPKIDP